MSKTDLQARIAALPPEKRAALLAKLREQEGRQGRAAQDDIPTVARDGEHHELSFAQQRLWFLQQFDTSSAEYNIPMGYRLLGPVDPHRLRQALVLLLERHESLRTTFITVDGEPRQVIHDTVDIRLPVVDLRPRDEDRREHDARFEMSVDAKTPFDLEKGPLLRGVLFQLDDREFLLYLNIHHVTFDGWSNGVLIRELMALYGALERDEDPATALPEMAIQYLDFAAWQRQHLAGDRMKRQIDYWKQRIEGTPPLELAPDRPRPAVRTYHGTTYPIDFGPEVSAQLEQLARDEDCTLFVTLMTAYRALLHRYTHQDDFAIGTLVANRTRSELEGLIGFFANTLAMRTPLTHETTFRELMRAEKETAFAAYDHQDVPFEKVVEELKPERDLARTPYFQVMMLLQNAPSQRQETAEEADPDAVRLGTFGVDSATSKFELTLYLTQGEQVSGFFEYNTDLFDRDTIARMAGHLRILVEGAVADPDRPLHAYPLMDDSERRMIVDAWNRTAVEFPREALVHEEFEARVDATPDKVALIAGEVRLTYRELDQRANRLAHHLLALGTEPEQFVGVCTDRSEHMVIALLAVMKAGCAYLPMDPDYPNDRLGYMLEDTAAPVILTLKSLVGKLPESTARVVVLDGDGEDALAIVQRDDARPALRNSAMNLAYVIHTSGSTGKPKGVPIPHRAVVNFLRTMAETPGLTADDTLLAVTTISFDIAGLELYLPLTVGSTLVLADRDTASAGEQLMKLLDTCGANVMQATPATWQLLYGAGWKGDPDLKVLCGGEALPPELAERLLRTCRTAWNVYGPTEATIWSTVHKVEADDGKAGAVPIGKPIANTQIYLVDRHFQPVPVGVPGELLIGGDGLARGYLNRPELAGDRFVPLPFPVDATAGERVYRTGDLVRWLPDGKLSFIGRIDHQVKVRGYRIELGEIEAVLDSHPAIERAVVIVREDQPGTVRLVGYMVAHPKDSAEHQPLPKPGDLKEFLKTKLPEYMVPAIFVPLDTMPLTPNGKVNRRALPKPDPTLFRTTEYVPPETDDEKAMAAIWAEVLGVKDVGLDDDFFDLGGDSLLVIRVVAKAKKADLVITTKQVFQNKTLRELVKVIGTTQILAEQGPVTGKIPLSAAQRQFLELDHTEPQWHTLGGMMTPKQGVYDVEALEKAFRIVLDHHDSLRVRLVRENDDWVLVSDPPWEDPPFDVRDYRDLPEEEATASFQEDAGAFVRSLDLLGGGRLIKGRLFLFTGREPIFFVFAHFFAADIGSWQVLLDDLDTAYRQLSRDEPLELQPKSTAFSQWMGKLKDWADSDVMKAEKEYWLSEKRQDVAEVIQDHPEGRNIMKASQSVYVHFDEDETETFTRRIPRATGAQIDAILLTSLLYAFEEWTDNRSMLVDLLGHGREPLFDEVDLTRTIGWLNVIFPTYITLGDAPHPAAAIKTVNQQLRSIPHGGLGYAMLRYLDDDPEVAAAFARQGEPAVFFNYFGSDHREELTVLTKADHFGGYGLDSETRRLRPLAVAGYVEEDKLKFRFEFSTEQLEEMTVQRLADKAEEILRHLLVHH